MFGFKHKKTISDDVLNQVFDDFWLGDSPIRQFIQKYDIYKDTLNLYLRLPDDIDVERLHTELNNALQLHGIYQINMSVTLYKAKKSAQNPPNHMPKTTNAMQPQKANADQTNINQAKPSKQSQIAPHPRIRHIVVVASGKGGVGKSTTTVNVALALQKLGKKVGVLDADIYGPSIPDMLGVAGVKPMVENGKFVPVSAFGMPVMSIGSLLDSDNTPVAWRGIKATGALMQLFNDTDFPYLDYLLIDMPPGTGDIQLTLAQRIPVTGAVIVTTPQHIALLDAQKGIEMFNKTDIGVVGVIENMALHTCTNCGFVDEIFGEGGATNLANRYEIPLLGKLPIAKTIRENMDNGTPCVVKDNEFAKFYMHIAQNIDRHIGKFAKAYDKNRIF